VAVQSNVNPHIRDEYSPLETLAMQALRRYGDFAPGTVDGDVILMFIEFANMVIDDIRMHPYWEGDDPPYYTSQSETRQIPDPVIIAGLLFHYAAQQQSSKIQSYAPNYFRTLNQQLWRLKNGNTKLRGMVVDGGSNPSYNIKETDPNNGLTE
jgi:hypothetical protein